MRQKVRFGDRYLFQNNVNVASNKLRNLLSFGSLDGIISFKIIAKILKIKQFKVNAEF